MKITVLLENTTTDPALRAEHGLSLFIEACGRKILFDTGQTDAFAENAEKLGIDLAGTDFAVLSHGHYDHGGGIRHFLECTAAAPVYLRGDAFGGHYHGAEKYIGLDPALRRHPRLVFTGDRTELSDDGSLTLFSCNDRPAAVPADPFGLELLTPDGLRPDTFRHEQYLLIRENGRTVLISGCSHKGILNLAAWFSPNVLVGGFHFSKLDPENAADAARLRHAAELLLGYPTVYFTGHCTGQTPYLFLRERMGDRLSAIHTGSVLEF